MKKTQIFQRMIWFVLLINLFWVSTKTIHAQSDPWQSLGPSTGGAGSVSIFAIAIDPFISSTLYVGTQRESVFKSTDRGLSWTEARVGMPSYIGFWYAVYCLSINPQNSLELYAGTSSSTLNPPGGVYRNTNGGADWWSCVLGTKILEVRTIAIDPKNPSTLYAGMSSVLKSEDGGSSWDECINGWTYPYVVYSIAIDPVDTDTIYAGTSNKGILKSTEAGASWINASNGLPTWWGSEDFCPVYCIVIDPLNPACLYAALSEGVFKSVDGGNYWSLSREGLPAIAILTLVVDPLNTAFVYAGTNGGGVYRSTNGGMNWTSVNDGLTNLTVHSLAVDPEDPSMLYAGTEAGLFSRTFDFTWITLSRTKLSYGAVLNSTSTHSQNVFITNSGSGTLNWTATSNQSWILVDPLAGTGAGSIQISVDPDTLPIGTYSGSVVISDPVASNSPQFITVNLNVYEAGEDSPPFGWFDTPVDGAIVSGSVPVTGWALDDIEVTKVEIKRDPDPDDPPEAIGSDGLVLISWEKVWEDPPGVEHRQNNVVFVKGSRTDVEGLYPIYPLCDRAGWGYMLLTYGLPRQGNGTFRLYAFAEDATGHRVLLGTKQITSDNANRVQPFGTIDTPEQGESIYGNYVNFGWALTPPPKMIPTDGSTIWISIDSIFVAQPDYNHFRQDIYDAFPGYLNCDGAVGFFYLDSTLYSNGVHTIGWYAVDNNGDADGFGSRFFEIQNIGGTPALIGGTDVLRYRVDTSGRLKISVEGQLWMEAEQLERIKIVLKGEGGDRFIGWGADENRSLPIGSTLDSEQGIFYWSIAPGFLNRHVLHFAVSDGAFRSEPAQVIVNIVPKRFDRFPKKVKIKDRKSE